MGKNIIKSGEKVLTITLFEKDLGGWALDIVYFEMIENLKEDKCIICYLKNKAMDKFFDDFLCESVNDHSLRDRILTLSVKRCF